MQHVFAEDLLAGAPTFAEYRVPLTMHKENREKLLVRLRAIPAAAHSFALFQGGQTMEQYDTDHELVFRQESNFQYLFGVQDADCLAGIDIATGKTFFFPPKRDASWAVWCGELYVVLRRTPHPSPS